MKSFPIILFLSFITSISYSQVLIDGVNISEREDIRVVEVLIEQRSFAKTVDVSVDYGQAANGGMNIKSTKMKIMDPVTNAKKEFTSAGALLNFMENNNWEHYNTIQLMESNFPLFYYYFRKKNK